MPASRSTSFRDPAYDDLDRAVEAQLRLPAGLLASVRLKGERSNSDQVSSAGARSVYQIIPETRRAVQRKYGVDAYASLRDAAMAAGFVLREGLERNGGNLAAAVAEYHGGTDRRNHGPVTRAYVGRVVGDGSSTFDRVRARRAAEQEAASGPSLKKVYVAYRQGKMSPEQAAQFEHDVNAGTVMLPPGGTLKRTPAAPSLPEGVVRAYNDLESGMTVEQRRQIDDDLREGVVSLPRRAKLNPWREMTAGEEAGRGLKLGLRSVLEGAGDVAGLVMNPVNSLLNMTGIPQRLTGKPLAMANDPSINLANKIGLPKPQFESEQMLSAVERGATGGLLTSGAGALVGALPGTAGAVGRAVASAPVADLVAGGASGGSAEVARQQGFGPAGQFVAALGGGGAGIAGVLAAERGAARITARRAGATPVPAPPRQVVLDGAGELTEEGQELIARHGFTPDEIKRAYDDARVPEETPSGPVADTSPPVAAATADNRPAPATVAPQEGGVAVDAPAAAAPPLIRPVEAPAATDIGDTASLGPPVDAAAKAPLGTAVPRTAADRMVDAEALGIPLTRAQATQDFAAQDAEQTLRATASPEGDKARTFLVEQAEKIRNATTRFREAFGSPDTTRTERGQLVKDALRELRDQGKAGINALYREVQEMGGDAVTLDATAIADAAKRVLIEADVPEGVKNVVRQELARHGIIGKDAVTAEDGLTTVKLSDGRKVQFYGDAEPLTVGNAERFRQAISAQYMSDGPRKLSQSIKGAVDEAVETAIEAAARDAVGGPVGAKLQQARAAVVTQKQTFSAKDVVQRLIDWKKGTPTDQVLPDNAMREVFAGEVSNLKKVKAILLSGGTETGKGAWRAVQAEGVGNILDKAYTANSNLGAGPTATISGAKLNSEIIRFGIPRLKVLLDEPDFARLMSLRRTIGEATIPVAGTTNPSGSAFKLMRFLTPMAAKFSGIPLAGPVIDVAAGLVRQAKATAEAKRTLDGMTTFDQSQAARSAAEPAPRSRGANAPMPNANAGADGDEGVIASFIEELIAASRGGRLSGAVLAAERETDRR